MKQNDQNVIRYATLRACMAEYLGCEATEVEDQDGTWLWGDEDGAHSMPMKEAISKILSRRVWGWLGNKDTMHIWFAKNVDHKRLLQVIAHEVGHSYRPWHRDTVREEQKADLYGVVAGTAFGIMMDLLGSDR